MIRCPHQSHRFVAPELLRIGEGESTTLGGIGDSADPNTHRFVLACCDGHRYGVVMKGLAEEGDGS